MRWLTVAAGVAFMAAPAASQPAATPAAAPLAYRLPGLAFERTGPDPRVPRAEAQADSLRPPDDWLGRDKALHFGASVLLTLSGQYVLTDKGGLTNGRALPVSAGLAFGLGVAKEVADSRRAVGPHFSLRDLAVDALGVAVGALVTRL
ncbi:MAG TPA: hypothetical protein VF594_07500 [Rubricoccaceae bacterium]